MLEQLIARMRDPSDDEWEAARDGLDTLVKSGTLSIEDAALLVRAAAEPFPPPEDKWSDRTPYLLWAARDICRDRDAHALFPEIERSFPRYTAECKLAALQIPVNAPSPAAADLYVRLLDAHGDTLGDGYLPRFDANAGPEVTKVLFPRLIALGRHRALAKVVYSTLLEFRKAGLVAPEIARDDHGTIHAVLTAEVERAVALQRPSGLGWRDGRDYSRHREMIGVLFDLAGWLNSARLTDFVADCGGLLDPRLRRFRAMTLLRLGRDVPDDELDWIAQSPRDRYWLFTQMTELGLADRLPAPCRHQESLAQGHMVDWLCFGTELGREPDEIETIHVETRNGSNAPFLIRWLAKRRPVDYYFFKFRVTEDHWSRSRGWMVGMAGGYARSEQPTTSHDLGTFSHFTALESKPIREHIADYLD